MLSLRYIAGVLLAWMASVVLADLELVPILDPTLPGAAHSSSKRAESFTGDLDLQDFETVRGPHSLFPITFLTDDMIVLLGCPSWREARLRQLNRLFP
jgi:hypothetical protein